MKFWRSIYEMACEDEDNQVLDPLRVGFMSGFALYLGAGLSMIAAALHTVWFLGTMPDLQAFGIGIAAWAGGLGVLLTGAGAGLWAKAKGDAAVPPPEGK